MGGGSRGTPGSLDWNRHDSTHARTPPRAGEKAWTNLAAGKAGARLSVVRGKGLVRVTSHRSWSSGTFR